MAASGTPDTGLRGKPAKRSATSSAVATGSEWRLKCRRSQYGELANSLRYAVQAPEHDDDCAGGRVMAHGAPPRPSSMRRSVRIGLRLIGKRQSLRSIDGGRSGGFGVTRRRSRFSTRVLVGYQLPTPSPQEHGQFVVLKDNCPGCRPSRDRRPDSLVNVAATCRMHREVGQKVLRCEGRLVCAE